MDLRSGRRIVGILGLVTIVALTTVSTAGCGGTEEAVTTTSTTKAAPALSLADYKAVVGTVLGDVQTANEAAETAIGAAESQPADDTAGVIVQAQLIQQAADQWSAGVTDARGALGEVTPPSEAGPFHSEMRALLEEYNTWIDVLSAYAAYTGAVMTAYNELEIAASAGGVFAELEILTEEAPADVQGRLELGEDAVAMLRHFQNEWDALDPPEAFADSHSALSADLATSLQTADQMLAELSGIAGAGGQGSETELAALTEQFDSQWAVVEDDMQTWMSAHESFWAGREADQQAFATQFGGLIGTLDSL